jgi:hypothetical protein
MSKSYRLELLIRHSNETALAARRDFKTQMEAVRKSFAFLDYHFRTLESEPKSLFRNVKMVLTTRFTNHLFSTLLLCERGLILDAFNCSRSGIETTAFYWLVCLDPNSAVLYEQERSPPPVEVRKRLEALGVDVNEIRQLYSFESGIAHVGNKYDNLQIRWEEGANGKLMVGGGSNPPVQCSMLEAMPSAIARFIRHDEKYIVTIEKDRFVIGDENDDSEAIRDPRRD